LPGTTAEAVTKKTKVPPTGTLLEDELKKHKEQLPKLVKLKLLRQSLILHIKL
jgi:hypothetical protein